MAISLVQDPSSEMFALKGTLPIYTPSFTLFPSLFTIMAWVKRSNTGDISLFSLINGFNVLQFQIASNLFKALYTPQTGSPESRTGPAIILPSGEWHHVAITRNEAIGRFIIYLDGVSLSSMSFLSVLTGVMEEGTRLSLVDSANSFYDVCVHNKELDPETIKYYFNNYENLQPPG